MNGFSSPKMLSRSEIIGLQECFSPTTREYAKGDIITICSQDDDKIGIVTEGIAYLITNNSDDQRRILDFYEKGNIFGRYFLPPSDNKLFYITAKTACRIDFVNYNKLIRCCSNSCIKHAEVINHMITSIAEKSLMHIDILGQRTLRSKLMTFFEYLSTHSKSNSFTVAMPFSDLADYLAVDRSAMMREIKKLNTEGIIKSDKKKITLLQQNAK